MSQSEQRHRGLWNRRSPVLTVHDSVIYRITSARLLSADLFSGWYILSNKWEAKLSPINMIFSATDDLHSGTDSGFMRSEVYTSLSLESLVQR